MSEESPKAIRERIGLTQVEMAIKADVSLSTIQAYEAGRLTNAQPRIQRKLAAAYSEDALIAPGSTARTDAAENSADQAA